jgi:GNAT superfamily N-acetyltransferase
LTVDIGRRTVARVGISEPVRRLALDPFGELPTPRDVEPVELDGASILINPWPAAQIVRPMGLGPRDVGLTVEASRAIARERGKRVLAWWITSEHSGLVQTLEDLGVVNTDTPGYEAIENGMALVSPPARPAAAEVEIGTVDTWDQYVATFEVARSVFGLPEVAQDTLRERYAAYLAELELGVALFAAIDGRIVAEAYGAFGSAGINLFGAAVTPEARGRGVYRSLVRARWDLAVARGTPALTVQAGRMSRPICERLGFAFVEAVRICVDNLPE